MNFLAKFITYVFQPLLMPTLVFYTILFHINNSSNLTSKGRWTVISLVFITTCLVPMLTVFMFKISKVIKDLNMKDRRDRYLPFIFISIFYLIVSYMIRTQEWMTPDMLIAFFTITTVVILTNAITFFWKISAHAAGVLGWLGFIMGFQQAYSTTNTLFWPLVVAILLSGFVSWSRLYLNAHKPKEIFAGAALGFIISFASVTLFV